VQQTKPLPEASTAPRPTAQTTASFPLRVERTGGIAGFEEKLSIQADGTVVGQTKRGQVSCTLDQGSLATLNEAALNIRQNDQPTGRPTVADGMTVTLSARFGTVGIEDPKVAAAQPVVTQLLADVSEPPSHRKICH
jgi:hypothetical protein